MLQLADPTGEDRPDPPELITFEGTHGNCCNFILPQKSVRLDSKMFYVFYVTLLFNLVLYVMSHVKTRVLSLKQVAEL